MNTVIAPAEQKNPPPPPASELPQCHFCVGDWVEVRGKEEILRTLDKNGEVDGMPFMPEMFAFCGKRFQVYKRAHKTCDTVFPIRGRRVESAVHLETRCDGMAHGGCEASCLLFWKEVWLKPVDANAPLNNLVTIASATQPAAICTEADVCGKAQQHDPNGGGPVYRCQATRLPYATTDLAWWELSQYIEDYRSGNVTLWRMLCGMTYATYFSFVQAGIGLGKPLRWLYDKLCPLWSESRYPRHTGLIPTGQSTPQRALNLQPGELVRVKSHKEILSTINTESKNRGMTWDAEMVPYCGKNYEVLKRVNKLVNERTGKMQEMKTPGIILKSVVCEARYSHCRMFCPRSIFPYWREIWLERVKGDKVA